MFLHVQVYDKVTSEGVKSSDHRRIELHRECCMFQTECVSYVTNLCAHYFDAWLLTKSLNSTIFHFFYRR